MSTSSLIVKSYLNTLSVEKDELRYNEKVDTLIKYSKYMNGGDFLAPLNFYLSILEDTNPVMFEYMSPEKKEQLLRDLQITYLLLLTEKKYESEHQKYENLKIYDSHLKKCQSLIDTLNYKKVCEEQKKIPSPEYEYRTDGLPVKYLGFFLGKEFAEKIVEAMDRKTKTIKEILGWVNEKRLYWVWGGGFLKTLLASLPPDFFNIEQATEVIKSPDPYTGTLSWAMYYFRFSLNFSLLLKHTIAGPWMSEEEKKIPWLERFLTQWDQRKFTLLNDFIWATGNLLCFFWLNGKGALGTLGDALTLGLLIFDITLAIWDFEEQKTRYNKEMLEFNFHIAQIKKVIKETENSPDNEDKDRALREYQLRLLGLERAKKHCKSEWKYQKRGLKYNIAYAIGLMLAFTLLTAPFFPISAPILAVISIIGAVLCLALTVFYNAIKGRLEVDKADTSAKEAKQDYLDKIKELKQLLRKNPDLNDNEKKFLFLEIKKLEAETAYHQQMVVFQTMHLVRSVLIEALIPALVFASLVFMPLGIGLGVIAAVIGLAIGTNVLVNTLFKPQKATIDTFDEKEYKAFCKHIEQISDKKPLETGFFKPVAEPAGKNGKPTSDEPDVGLPLLSSNS